MTSLLSRTDADRIGRNNFIKSAVTFDVGKDRLLLNYDLTKTIMTAIPWVMVLVSVLMMPLCTKTYIDRQLCHGIHVCCRTN
jgi:hypothetical protein